MARWPRHRPSLALLALALALGCPAEAAHQFDGVPGFDYLPLSAGQKVVFTVDDNNDGGNPTVGGTFVINILALLNPDHPDLNWSAGDVVKFNIYLTRREDVAAWREVVATKDFAGQAPSSTLVIVASLVSPDFQVEIAAVAARA